MQGSYTPTLVVASILIAILASYALLALTSRVTASRGRFRTAWLAGGSVSVGVGIWAMHFVGMLAFRLPVAMAYSVPTVVLSLLVPIAAAALALFVASRPVVRAWWMAAAVAMGVALVGMHVIGMSALRVPAHLSHRPALVAASVAVAMVSAFAALWSAVRLRAEETPRGRRLKGAAAAVVGSGIAVMHYTAMSAARFTSVQGTLRLPDEAVLQTTGLAAGIALATLVLLTVTVLGALVDRRARARNAETEALRRSEDRFRSLVLATAQVVWTADPSGEIVSEQPEWGTFTGCGPDEYRGMAWLNAVHPEDRERVAHAWRTAVERRTLLSADHRLRRADGEWRDVSMRGVPVLEPGGRVREWVGAITDVTERRRVERGRDFLAEVSRVLASSLDYQATLGAIARLAVPALADWCAVDLLVEGTRTERVAVEHPDPRKVELAVALHERYPQDAGAAHGLEKVIRTGEPDMMSVIPVGMMEEAARDAEHLRLIRALGLRSYLIVPLVARDKVLGAITLVHAESGRAYDAADLALAEEVARRAAVAIDNARLFAETEEARQQLEQQAAELQEAQAEMEMAHDELQRANDDLVARTADAERAREAADEANAAKSAFLATMSHELRTPLNAIAGYAQLLEMGIHGPLGDMQREYLEKIRRNQTHLLGLINDVLNFAKIEAGQVVYDIDDVAVDESLAAIEALIEPQVRARSHAYTYRRGDPSVTVRADRERMEQVVLNLLTNAVKFTEPGGRIVLEWEADDRRVQIRVSDTGRGIPADRMGVIFEPFVQVDPALTRSSEGTGLGLAISRDLARSMDGDLTVKSEEGAGSVFTLTLPQGRPAAAQTRVA
jgi:PAS domain S-box-containing protein